MPADPAPAGGPSFGDRLGSTFAASGHLCVGIDPHPYLLHSWGLADSAEGLREFGLRVVDATAGRAGIVKPQVAFFERHGAAGFGALERVLGAARAAGLLVIADVKRGDLGTSVEGYAEAWLTPGSSLESDAMTISAYQGVGSLEAPVRIATHHGKGLFVLGATSNPESREVQTAVIARGPNAGRTVAAGIVTEVNRLNSAPIGSFGVVIGATVDLAEHGILPSDLSATPILAPGFGHQGARLDDLHRLFGAASERVIVSSSRAILDAGPDGIAAEVTAQASAVREAYAA
ncbi:orotidine-5'-phosphate decarboxylase [Galbitalea soli]|uniref:Orotidine-5'-phosphate decarboxylase n=1 Tax=Galbitalea soli TaxID=1268042 RepID=A0A7C9PLQ9_9MICO|nr:orotidine-5'-phosphate decarboxylase [Galbitalea soli]NEM90208.1 orotidine-5'-phosphate decarboxylase [Galbitalea soli]NYJ30916.1 orotidine-5'-phosphate decarboxylase [Galbitalea soli]